MVGYTYEQIVGKICTEKNLKEEEVHQRVKEKLKQLSDLVSKEGAAHIVGNELGVRIYEQAKLRQVKIQDLNSSLKNIEVIGKITKIWGVRSFRTIAREGRVANLSVGDETGACRFVFWDEKQIKEIETGKIKEGDIVKITNGYVRENMRGEKEVHLGNLGTLQINPEGVAMDVKSPIDGAQRKAIKDLSENETTSIIGTLVQIFEPRFYESCPQCGKKVEFGEQGLQCSVHGPVETVMQPVLNIIVDDGTENIRVVCFRDNVKKVLELENLFEIQENPDLFRDVQRKVAGKQLKILGRVTRNTFFDRLEMIANIIEEANPRELAVEMQ